MQPENPPPNPRLGTLHTEGPDQWGYMDGSWVKIEPNPYWPHPVDGLAWFVVVDRDEPDWGALCVLAPSKEEARVRGHQRWYDDYGDDETTLDSLAVAYLPIPVTDEQCLRHAARKTTPTNQST